MLAKDHHQLILTATGSKTIDRVERIQSLWSGYGEILRVWLGGSKFHCVIVKRVDPPETPETQQHPRNWNTNTSHVRKVQSYHVEAIWYQKYSAQLDEDCRVADCLAVVSTPQGHIFVLEDLDANGFHVRFHWPKLDDIRRGLRWLARFHAFWLGHATDGLWPVATYWHLATRQDELLAMPDNHPLKAMAHRIDERLSACPYQTILHGDAKVANFCFHADGQRIAAVDFQYVGGGCGMKDVAYFLGSCLSEDDCLRHADSLLGGYFTEFRQAVTDRSTGIRSSQLRPNGQSTTEACFNDQIDEIERLWRDLYPLAWADFHRFLSGWSPGHHKLHDYSRQMTELALQRLD